VTLAGCLGLMLGCAPAPPAAQQARPETPRVAGAAVVPPSAQTEVRLKHPTSKTPWLGIEMEDGPGGRPGILIARVLRGSPAAGAGLRAGDEILGLDGTALSAPSDLSRALRELDVGDEIPVTVLRGGSSRIFRVALEGQPAFEDQLRLTFVGLPAPSISGVVTFQGEAASLRELRGKVVLLEFWASWCEVCRYLAPVLGRWQRTYRPAGLEVVGLTLDPPDVAAAAAFRVGMAYTLASDAGGEVTESYLATQIPAVFVIDRQGIVADVMVGVQSARLDEVQELIGRLLDSPSQYSVVPASESKAEGG